jgi:hypothetical protein
MNWLDALADLASIVTAIVAGGAVALYWCGRKERQRRLEVYLRTTPDRDSGSDRAGEVTVGTLMAKLSMTEAQVLEAAFSSSKITPVHRGDRGPIQQAMMLKYTGD